MVSGKVNSGAGVPKGNIVDKVSDIFFVFYNREEGDLLKYAGFIPSLPGAVGQEQNY